MARRHFSSQALVLIVISIAINMIGGQLASMVKLPIFLDSVGTLISAVLLGPVIGMLVNTDQFTLGIADRPDRRRICARRDGHRPGQWLAGASGLVPHPAKSRC